MLRRLATRTAVVAATTALAALTLAGSAEAQRGVGYVGYGQTNNWNAVMCVQQNINNAIAYYGIPHPYISEDGSFGPETDEAVRYMQNGWFGPSGADGIVGPRTGDAILKYGQTYLEHCYRYVPTSY
ncbi:peptidoglycan-binding protein [Streptomyces sp. NBC_01077]|uniref:peptidoglycan-binding domain-containing protein n=1 Tax=Streptomyces sp. NBC_01077 TaxID=2903746 RepID=UPI00386D0BBC|nr:peptidoglycan-binding protein [Streptomyces sp. NBC_01077]